jgi:hypothetical protein
MRNGLQAGGSIQSHLRMLTPQGCEDAHSAIQSGAFQRGVEHPLMRNRFAGRRQFPFASEDAYSSAL